MLAFHVFSIQSYMQTVLQFTIAKDVREQTQYEKKFPLASVTPAVGHFGGRSVDVWAAVTSSGAVRAGACDTHYP